MLKIGQNPRVESELLLALSQMLCEGQQQYLHGTLFLQTMPDRQQKRLYGDYNYKESPMVRLRRIFHNPLIPITIVLSLYWVGAWLFPNPPYFEFLRIIASSIAVVPLVGYWRYAFKGLGKAYPDYAQQLMMSVTLFCFIQFLMDIWQLIWRLAGRPPWWLDSPVYGFFIYLSILAAMLCATAPGALQGRIPTRNLLMIGVSCGIACCLFLIMLWFKLDASGLLSLLRPYLGGD